MLISDRAGSRPRRRPLSLLLGRVVLAVVVSCTLSGCSALSLHKSSPREPLTNPWIKPAKPETTGEKVKGFFWKEKKPKYPKDWLGQKRPE
jgi:hypothetical protein